MVSKKSLKNFMQSTGKLFDLMSPSEDNAQAIMEWIMPDLDVDELAVSLRYYYKYMESNDVKYVNYFDPVPGLFSKYGSIQKHQKVAKKVGLTWWPYIQKYVANPEYVLTMVGRKKPEIKRMLSTPLGQSYIEYFTKRLYQFFDLWFHKFPRWHNDCGGLIEYKLVNKKTNAWGWTCRRCGNIIGNDDIDTLTYSIRKHKIRGGTYSNKKDAQ